MAIMLPGPVVGFLSAIGITWPDINEDTVREFGHHVAEFANNLDQTHSAATDTLNQMGQAYQGAGYEQLLSTWGQMSSSHMSQLVTGCHLVSTAMDVGADVIIGMKVAAIGELIALAVSFVAAQAAAALTFGIAEAAVIAIEQAGRFLMKELVRQLVDYVTGQVIEAAIGPLIEKVTEAVAGLVFKGVANALGAGGGPSGESVMIDTAAVTQHAAQMEQHAATMAGHADQFVSVAAGVNFE